MSILQTRSFEDFAILASSSPVLVDAVRIASHMDKPDTKYRVVKILTKAGSPVIARTSTNK